MFIEIQEKIELENRDAPYVWGPEADDPSRYAWVERNAAEYRSGNISRLAFGCAFYLWQRAGSRLN